MATQIELLQEKTVIDLSFIETLRMREKDITNWKDVDAALAELFYLRNKLSEAHTFKNKQLSAVHDRFEEPINKLEALKNLLEGKISTFSKLYCGEDWKHEKNPETGEETISKSLDHGEVTITTKSKVRLTSIA